jgi:hypothetical protein
MLLSRLRELSTALDERVPGRAGFRHWRRTCPFWGGVSVLLGGLVILMLPMAPLPVMIHVGMAAVSGVAIGSILIAAALFFWFAPAQRAFVAVVASICALVSVVTTNLGGGGIGALLALLGSAMAFGWRPGTPQPAPESPGPEAPQATPESPESPGPGTPEPASEYPGPRTPEPASENSGPGTTQPVSESPAPGFPREPVGTGPLPDNRPNVPLPRAAPLRSAEPPPPAAHRSAESSVRWGSLLVTVPIAVSAGLFAAVVAHRPATAEAAPAVSTTCVPVPGATRPWWIPEWLWLACPNPSTNPSASPPASSSPAPTSGNTTGTATPSASVSSKPAPSVSVSASASAGMTAAPRMTAPGRITAIRYGENVPEVSADKLMATGFTFRGTVDLPTDGGTVKALVFHADNLKADNYRILTKDPGPDLRLGIDLDIDDVDIYATHLGGLITVPYLDVPLLPVEITADLIPTWLPLNIWLPAFSGNGVEAGQVFIRAGTVRGSDLSAQVVGAQTL